MATNDIAQKIEDALDLKQDASLAINANLNVGAIEKSIENVDNIIGNAIQEELDEINKNKVNPNTSDLKYEGLGAAAIPTIKGIYAGEPDKLKAFEEKMAKVPSKNDAMVAIQESAYNLLLARKALIQDSEAKIAEFEKVDKEFIDELKKKDKEIETITKEHDKITEELETLKDEKEALEAEIAEFDNKLSDPAISDDDRDFYEAEKAVCERKLKKKEESISIKEPIENSIFVSIDDAGKEKEIIEKEQAKYKKNLSKFKDSAKGQKEKAEKDSEQFIGLFKKHGVDFEAFAMSKGSKEADKQGDSLNPNTDPKKEADSKNTQKEGTAKGGQTSGVASGAVAPQQEQAENSNLPMSYEKDPSYRKMAKARAKSLADKYKKLTGPQKQKFINSDECAELLETAKHLPFFQKLSLRRTLNLEALSMNPLEKNAFSTMLQDSLGVAPDELDMDYEKLFTDKENGILNGYKNIDDGEVLEIKGLLEKIEAKRANNELSDEDYEKLDKNFISFVRHAALKDQTHEHMPRRGKKAVAYTKSHAAKQGIVNSLKGFAKYTEPQSKEPTFFEKLGKDVNKDTIVDKQFPPRQTDTGPII